MAEEVGMGETSEDTAGLTGALAHFAAEADLAAAAADWDTHAARWLVDALGAGLYGMRTPAARIVAAEALASSGAGGARLWGTPHTLDAAAAAMANGTAAHAFELDDYHPGAKLHPGAVVVPAALAALDDCDEPVGRDRFLAALVAGYEVMVRASLAARSAAVRRRGWHCTGVFGPLGAAAATGRLWGIDAATLTHALGIAGSYASGTFAFSREGAMTKRFHAGKAAQAGVVACRLAARGFRGPTRGLEQADGGLLHAVSDEADVDGGLRRLGEELAALGTAVKPYPCCGSVHSSIDAALALRDRLGAPDASAVSRVVAFNSSAVRQQCYFPYSGSGSALEAQMNLPYCIAVALLDGEVGLAQFAEPRLSAPDVKDLCGKVDFEPDADIEARYPLSFPARVRVELSAGTVEEVDVPHPRGTPQVPLTDEGLEGKFRDLAGAVLPADGVEAVLAACRAPTGDLRDLNRVCGGPLEPT